MDELEYRLKIDALRTRIYNLNRELKDANTKYDELKQRYIRQNNELCKLKVLLGIENENKSRNSKK